MTSLAAARRLTEAEFQAQIVELAERLGWWWMHVEKRLVSRDDGRDHYRETPTKGPLGKGWPDLVLVRDRVIYVELKALRGTLKPEQKTVRDALRDADAEWYRWDPRDFDEAVAVLTRRGR